MDWTNAKTIEFIQTMETYPVIWDSNHVDFRNRVKKHQACQELAEIFNCDSTEVMRKWKIVLAQYRREKKKIVSKIMGSRTWFGYEHLNFLHNSDEPNDGNDSYDEMNEQLIHDDSGHMENEHREEKYAPEVEVQILEVPKYPRKRRAVEEDSRNAQDCFLMNNVKKSIDDRKQDDNDIFAAGVSMKLRKIKNERTKILVQRDIDNLLYDAIIGNGNFDRTSMSSA